jgi:hypothetical protein
MTLGPGLHRGVPMRTYLSLPALGSTHLNWLATSPLHYRYMTGQPAEESPSLALGTALHMAVLEPELFEKTYVLEPLAAAGSDAKSPRATKAFKDAVEDIQQGGFTVLRTDVMETVRAMTASVWAHPKAAALLKRAPDHEVTMLWERNGRLLRGRADMIGPRVIGDLKTTRSLAKFSPWAIDEFGYHRQAALYEDGADELLGGIDYYFFVAVESSPPHDVGVFRLDEAALVCGRVERDHHLRTLDECERTNHWPGMFPDVVTATVPDSLIASMGEEAVA